MKRSKRALIHITSIIMCTLDSRPSPLLDVQSWLLSVYWKILGIEFTSCDHTRIWLNFLENKIRAAKLRKEENLHRFDPPISFD